MASKKITVRELDRRPFSRRTLLKGLGVGLGAGALGASTHYGAARAQGAAVPTEGPLGLTRTTVGELELTVIQDSSLQLPPDAFGGGAPEGAVTELLGRFNLPTDSLAASANVLLLRSGGELTLIDSGNGGNLLPTLEAVGVSPADVSRVVLTHWHGDHVSGVSADGTLNFPNATHHFPQLDWEFLQAQAGSDERIQGSLDRLSPADEAGVLELYDGEGDIVPGLAGVPAYGHTPGHHALLLSSGRSSLLLTADTANHPVVALMHPEWSFSFDADAAQATETRRQLFGRAADEGLQVFAYHFAFPGFGYVMRDGDGFRFTASV